MIFYKIIEEKLTQYDSLRLAHSYSYNFFVNKEIPIYFFFNFVPIAIIECYWNKAVIDA